MSHEGRDQPRRFRRAEIDAALAHLKQEDLQLLRWLLRYPFSRAEDLAQARSITSSTVYRHLSVLQKLGVVESITAAMLGTTSCSLYHLSNLAACRKKGSPGRKVVQSCGKMRQEMRMNPVRHRLLSMQRSRASHQQEGTPQKNRLGHALGQCLR